jgi:hypothetical protein
MMDKKPSAPPGTARKGRALWKKVVDSYDLRTDELATLEDACRITDMIDELETAWINEGRPTTAKGSTGQLIIHPLIGEIRTQRMARNALFRQLKLPDGAEYGAEANQQRSAAQSRWASQHGNVA